MSTVKIHGGSFQDDGIESCDYRGKGELQAKDGDHHATLLEWEYGPDVATNEHIEEVLRDGPAFNRQMKRVLGAAQSGVKPTGKLVNALKIAGVNIGDGFEIRQGVFDH